MPFRVEQDITQNQSLRVIYQSATKHGPYIFFAHTIQIYCKGMLCRGTSNQNGDDVAHIFYNKLPNNYCVAT